MVVAAPTTVQVIEHDTGGNQGIRAGDERYPRVLAARNSTSEEDRV